MAGYLFIRDFNKYAFETRRQSSYHVLFSSGIAGFCLLAISIVITSLLNRELPSKNWGDLFGFNWLLPSVLCIPLASTCYLLNKIPQYRQREAAYLEAIKRNDILELLITEAIVDRIPVAISLKSGKVYIGYITEEGDKYVGERKEISILPVLSGYRKTDTKELIITTNYAKTIKKLEFDPLVSYEVVIPVAEIETARYHESNLFQAFQEDT